MTLLPYLTQLTDDSYLLAVVSEVFCKNANFLYYLLAPTNYLYIYTSIQTSTDVASNGKEWFHWHPTFVYDCRDMQGHWTLLAMSEAMLWPLRSVTSSPWELFRNLNILFASFRNMSQEGHLIHLVYFKSKLPWDLSLRNIPLLHVAQVSETHWDRLEEQYESKLI